jgi:hypothetical protein
MRSKSDDEINFVVIIILRSYSPGFLDPGADIGAPIWRTATTSLTRHCNRQTECQRKRKGRKRTSSEPQDHLAVVLNASIYHITQALNPRLAKRKCPERI